MFFLLPLYFAKTPAPELDSGSTSDTAMPDNPATPPTQSGAISDSMQISKKEYQDLLSAKGLLSSIHSQRDADRQLYEQNVTALRTEMEQMQQTPQTSAIDQLLSSNGDNDDYEENNSMVKQIAQALSADMDSRFASQDEKLQHLNELISNTQQEQQVSSRITQRKANIDNVMNDKVTDIQEQYYVDRTDATDFVNSREKAIKALQQLPDADDNEVGALYSLVDDIIDDVAKRKIDMQTHKAKVDTEKTTYEKRLKTLLDGDRKTVAIDVRREIPEGLPQKRDEETFEEYSYRAARDRFKKLQKDKNIDTTAGFK